MGVEGRGCGRMRVRACGGQGNPDGRAGWGSPPGAVRPTTAPLPAARTAPHRAYGQHGTRSSGLQVASGRRCGGRSDVRNGSVAR